MSTPTREYVEQRVAQINAAVAADSDLVLPILALIRADGHPDLADALAQELVERGLDNLTTGAGR